MGDGAKVDEYTKVTVAIKNYRSGVESFTYWMGGWRMSKIAKSMEVKIANTPVNARTLEKHR